VFALSIDEPRANRRPLRALAAGAVVVLVILAALVFVFPRSGSGALKSSSTLTATASVTVFGLVSTTGPGTHATSMIFTSERDGQTFIAPTSWPGTGRFSIELPNDDKYGVAVGWAGNYSWQQGQTDQGVMSLNVSAGSQAAQSYNVVFPTPDAVVLVDGAVAWQINGSNPIAIRFTAGDGQNFTAAVANQGTFSIRLPNLVTYEVSVQSQNATGYSDWYYAHQMVISAGVNVVGLTVRIAL
jgi:hypothetical protein